MDLLESPLEALAFRYSVTAVSSLWTWLAVVTAAFGFWRIRAIASYYALVPAASTAAPQQHQPAKSAGPIPRLAPSLPEPKPENKLFFFSAPRPEEPERSACRLGSCSKEPVFEECGDYSFHEEEDGSSSGEEEEEGIGEGRDEEAVPVEEIQWGCGSIRWGKEKNGRREALRGDMGWYRFQDFTAINGSVVRLWEEEGRAASPPTQLMAGRGLRRSWQLQG